MDIADKSITKTVLNDLERQCQLPNSVVKIPEVQQPSLESLLAVVIQTHYQESFSFKKVCNWSTATRSWTILSRSLTVTELSSRVSKSIVTQ